MKTFFILVFSISIFSQEQPLKYTFLPHKLNIDSLMPNTSPIDTSANDFTSIPIDSGKLITIYRDTLKLHPGVLISERKAALFIYYKNNCEYLHKKVILSNKLYNELYDNTLAAEKTYQDEIKQLRKKAERSWIERNLVYIGFVAGIATAILTEFAVAKTIRD